MLKEKKIGVRGPLSSNVVPPLLMGIHSSISRCFFLYSLESKELLL